MILSHRSKTCKQYQISPAKGPKALGLPSPVNRPKPNDTGIKTTSIPLRINPMLLYHSSFWDSDNPLYLSPHGVPRETRHLSHGDPPGTGLYPVALSGLNVSRWHVTISIRRSYHIMNFTSQNSSSSQAKSSPLPAPNRYRFTFNSRRGDGGEVGNKFTGHRTKGPRSSVPVYRSNTSFYPPMPDRISPPANGLSARNLY